MKLNLPPKRLYLVCMFKKRYFSAHHDFKTGIFCKLSLFFGVLFLIIFVLLKIFSMVISKESTGFAKELYNISTSTVPESFLAFSLILIVVGLILYYFHCQFAKLSKIADEIENLKEMSEEDEKKVD
jgi:hypothetical protein